jgi:hypothetical protein
LSTATLGRPGRRSLIGKLGSAVAARARAKGKPSKLAAAFTVARQHVVTVAALASVDVGAFHGCQVAGWVVTGVSLLALDFAVTS